MTSCPGIDSRHTRCSYCFGTVTPQASRHGVPCIHYTKGNCKLCLLTLSLAHEDNNYQLEAEHASHFDAVAGYRTLQASHLKRSIFRFLLHFTLGVSWKERSSRDDEEKCTTLLHCILVQAATKARGITIHMRTTQLSRSPLNDHFAGLILNYTIYAVKDTHNL